MLSLPPERQFSALAVSEMVGIGISILPSTFKYEKDLEGRASNKHFFFTLRRDETKINQRKNTPPTKNIKK